MLLTSSCALMMDTSLQPFVGRKNIVPFYAKNGYKNITWDILVYEGQVNLEKLPSVALDSVHIVPVSSVKFEDLMKYDQDIHSGVERSLYWQNCFAKENVEYLVAVKEDKIIGLCGLRPFKSGCVYVGPIYADSLEIAKVLAKSIFEKARPSRFAMESIEPNSFLGEFVSWLEVSVNHTLTRQYTCEEVPLCYDKIYGVAETDIYFA